MADIVPLRPSGRLFRGSDPLWRHLVGEQLRRRRHAKGEKLVDVARRAGVSVQYLSEIERGRKEPSSEILAAVLGALDVSLLDLTNDIAAGLSPSIGASTPLAQPAPTGTQVGLALAA